MTKPAWEILAALRDAGGRITHSQLVRIVEPDELEAQIGLFSRRGYSLSLDDKGALVLEKWPRRLFSEEIARGLSTQTVARSISIHWVTASTNDLAREHTRRGGDGAAVFAEEQTGGRGRFGRRWTAPRFSSLLFSVSLFSPGRTVNPDALALAGAASVCEAVSQVTNLPAQIKWPNDVVIEGRKISGVLVEGLARESEGQWLVIGIGINVNVNTSELPDELSGTAGSLSGFLGTQVDRALVARAVLRRLDYWWHLLRSGNVRPLSEYVRRVSCQMGAFVTVESAGSRYRGRVVDVDVEEGLVLQLSGGPARAFAPGSATVVR